MRRPPSDTRTDPLFPYRTLFRSATAIGYSSGLFLAGVVASVTASDTFFPVESKVPPTGFGGRKFGDCTQYRQIPEPTLFQAAAPAVWPRDSRDTTELARFPLRASLLSRSAARRVGKECVSTCRSRWLPYH